MLELLRSAAVYARKRLDERTFYVGAIAIRKDGVIVKARNEATQHPCHAGHAEARIVNKLDFYATVYVGRMVATGDLAMAKPCKKCQMILKAHKIKKVYYSISSNEYGCMDYSELGYN